MKAIICCGGMGTRLRPLTYTTPKPMLPLGNKPILEYVIRHLKRNGFTDLYLTVGYLKEQIMDYFGDGKKWGVKIQYAVEEGEAGTAGSIVPLKKWASEPFIVQMGDHLSRLDLKKMYAYHKKEGHLATVALKRTGVPLEYGIAKLDDASRIIAFEEKPIVRNFVNAGVYVFNPKIFDYIKPKEDFAKNVFPRLLSERQAIGGFVFDDYWLDIGRPSDYEKVNEMITLMEMVGEME
ncbi:Bifunctional protein GlmU [uncultured archaeon]|nr:Bifunctional protein GlmU [uncultured archaeon]